MLEALPQDTPGARLRHAEVLYSRAEPGDRDRSAVLLRMVLATATDDSTRLHCLLRLGDIARGRAAGRTGGPRTLVDLAEAYVRPLRVIAATRNGRRQPEEAGDAYRALQQTSLRLFEQLASVAPRGSRPAIGLLCRGAATFGVRAARLARNGNRLSLVRQHRALLLALSALLRGRPAAPGLRTDMQALRATYRAADDPAGAANCAITLALLTCADGDPAAARALIAEALAGYCEGRPAGRPLPSGAALVAVMTRLIDRVGRASGT
jgi:hypothetical protein